MGQYIIQLSEHYIDPATKKLALNPNVAAHKKEHGEKVFKSSVVPLEICVSLDDLDDLCDLDLDVEDESDEELGFPYSGTGF
jgi:hypothetical protein